MKFEITEDTVIRLSAISHAVSGAQALVTPNEFQDIYMSKDVPRSNMGTQLLGHALVDVGIMTYAHSGEEATLESKKRALKVLSAVHAGCAAHFVYRVQQKESPLTAGLSTAAGMALLSGLCAWKGFSKDEKKEEEDVDTKKKK